MEAMRSVGYEGAVEAVRESCRIWRRKEHSSLFARAINYAVHPVEFALGHTEPLHMLLVLPVSAAPQAVEVDTAKELAEQGVDLALRPSQVSQALEGHLLGVVICKVCDGEAGEVTHERSHNGLVFQVAELVVLGRDKGHVATALVFPLPHAVGYVLRRHSNFEEEEAQLVGNIRHRGIVCPAASVVLVDNIESQIRVLVAIQKVQKSVNIDVSWSAGVRLARRLDLKNTKVFWGSLGGQCQGQTQFQLLFWRASRQPIGQPIRQALRQPPLLLGRG